jgi:predicted RNase H-like nuclease (RuvC/YqgF family)
MSANAAAGTDKRIQQSSTGGDNPETKARHDEGEIFVLRGEVKNIQEDLDKKETRIRDLEAQLEKSEARIRELEAALVQVRHTASNVLCM